MEAKLRKWGNGSGVLLKKEILEQIGVAIGEVLEAEVIDGAIVLTPKFRHRSLRERAAEYGGELNLKGEVVDWGDPIGREIW